MKRFHFYATQRRRRHPLRIFTLITLALFLFCSGIVGPHAFAALHERQVTGVIVNKKKETVAGATITVRTRSGEQTVTSDENGAFSIDAPHGEFTLAIGGRNVSAVERQIGSSDKTEGLEIEVDYTIDPIHDGVVIEASSFDPTINRRNESVYRDTLFSRDDQIFQTLDSGFNVGQHEGGGKSLEIRRFGFNLDHGGVNGGVKVLVDGVQQNQGTQGHGQGYLGNLKSLTPELIQEVNVLNGPFSGEYGDFSSLGVVRIRLKEELPEQLLLRLQGGSFSTSRGFVGYSPHLKSAKALFTYENSRTDGPFETPLRYYRDNAAGSFVRKFGEHQTLGFKFNLGRNDYFSSGQIPLDLIDARELPRFGFIDPTLGGRVRNGTGNVYYQREFENGSSLKLDGSINRTLFDLFSNFTFFLNDEQNGDQIQQHDSRLQQAVNAQYLKPFKLFGQQSLLTAGANLQSSQVLVGLNNSLRRDPIAIVTKDQARINNPGAYVQQAMDFFSGRLHVDGGVRMDYFRYSVDNLVDPTFASGTEDVTRFQPKFNLAVTPSQVKFPVTFHFNYGRGVGSQDARGVVRQPDGPKVSTTDFYQVGASYHNRRYSFSSSLFLIDTSNQQVFIADDGSGVELAGPSRSYGYETKFSAAVNRFVTLNGGITHVGNVFFRGTSPRIYVDSAPRNVANAAVTLTNFKGFTSSVRMRYIDSYRLDGEDPSIRASGFTVLDFSMVKQITRFLDVNLAVDNFNNKRFFEVQNFFESRARPGDPVVSRVHGTPGYPTTLTVGVTLHLFRKD
jgi:hypothetical protein